VNKTLDWVTRSVAAASAVVMVVGGWSLTAYAQVADPAPDGTMPGAQTLTKMLGWLKYAAGGAAVAAMLIGAISIAVGHFGTHGGAAQAGRKWLLGGMGAAIIMGMGYGLVTALSATG
jgi:hypothetical protein